MHIKHKYLLFGLFGIEKTVFSANMLSSFCRNCSLYINLILYHLPVDGSTYLILRKESLYNNNTVAPNIQVSFCVCVCMYVCVYVPISAPQIPRQNPKFLFLKLSLFGIGSKYLPYSTWILIHIFMSWNQKIIPYMMSDEKNKIRVY